MAAADAFVGDCGRARQAELAARAKAALKTLECMTAELAERESDCFVGRGREEGRDRECRAIFHLHISFQSPTCPHQSALLWKASRFSHPSFHDQPSGEERQGEGVWIEHGRYWLADGVKCNLSTLIQSIFHLVVNSCGKSQSPGAAVE